MNQFLRTLQSNPEKICREIEQMLQTSMKKLNRNYALLYKERLIEESDNLMMDMRAVNKIIADWFEVPRRIINAIPGIKFNEMYRSKSDSFCCGAGGGVRAQYPEFSLRTAHLHMDEGDAVGADIMLTECPFCWRNLDDANTKYKHGKQVMTILEMISKYELVESKRFPWKRLCGNIMQKSIFPAKRRKNKIAR